jgi:integrase
MKGMGYAYKTINNYKRSLMASYYTAISDDYVRKNPFHFPLNTVIEDDSKTKEVLSEEQEQRLLAFVEQDFIYQKYYDELVLLLKTGLRISEFCGLTLQDIDFENEVINIDHQLLRDSKNGYYIAPPKTKSGERLVPMSKEVKGVLQRVIKNRGKAKPFEIDGYHDFLFLDKRGMPRVACNYKSIFNNLVKRYNKGHEDKIPKLTPHILRHTFCTGLANKNMNPKSLQYVMGHANISTTLNLYAHSSLDKVKSEITSLIG